jgi:cell division protein FtsX
MSRGYYSVGASWFDDEFKRAEALKASTVQDVNKIVDRVQSTAKGIQAALIAGAAVTALSTVALIRQVRKGRR